MIEKIDQEIAHQKAGKTGRILVKLNGLLEPAIVQELYRASQAGCASTWSAAASVPAAGTARRQRNGPCDLHRGPFPGTQPHLLLRPAPATRRFTSARPTGWTAT